MEIIKLIPREKGKFHFGRLNLEIDDALFHSDSLFSAICNNYIRNYGDERINEFIESFPKITSLFYGIKKDRNEILFIPKPMKFMLPKQFMEGDRKLAKKIRFVSLKTYKGYFEGGWDERSDLVYNKDESKDCLYLNEEYSQEDLRLFSNEEDEKVSINRQTSVSEEGILYNISSITLEKDVFFYFIVNGILTEQFKQSLKLIKDFGIGGKISTGYGQIKEIAPLSLPDFPDANGNCKASLSIIFPRNSELDSAMAYKLIERKGYIYNSSTRRKPLLGFAEGSIFKEDVEGAVVDVSQNSMPAKRFGKAFLIPFKVSENEA